MKTHRFDHIVVLMLENRSFDQVAGYLYDPHSAKESDRPARGQPFDGVADKTLSNPLPGVGSSAAHAIYVRPATSLDIPQVDPGETFAHVARQIYGTYPVFHGQRDVKMNGFVKDFARVLQEGVGQPLAGGSLPTEGLRQIMQCYTPESLPVLSSLARSYAVCDRYFSSVPSQTWANRAFLHAGTSRGLVNNEPYTEWVKNAAPTLFNRISDAKREDLSWRVYYSVKDILPLTLMIHLPALFPYAWTHFSPLDQFYEDCARGTLPSYAYLEPQFLGPDANDQHPPSSMLPGEWLLFQVYEALRVSPCFERTLLIVTYDEHGGCYDHVPPPVAVPPDLNKPLGQCNFRFDRLGVRVCTVLISPYIEQGTVFRPRDASGKEVPADHTAILHTATERFGLSYLTERDRQAVDLAQVLTRSTPRTDAPRVMPHPYYGTPATARVEHRGQRDLHELFHASLTSLGDHAREVFTWFETRR